MNANLVPGACRALTCQPALYLIGLATVSETESMPEQHPHKIDRRRVFAPVDREPKPADPNPAR